MHNKYAKKVLTGPFEATILKKASEVAFSMSDRCKPANQETLGIRIMPNPHISRRAFGAGLIGAAGAASAPLLAPRPAWASDRLLVVQWGAMWHEVSQEIARRFNETNDARIAWELHSGGAAAVVARIQASWPNTLYNVIAAWDPVFRSMIAEDWLEPIDESIVTNLSAIPSQFIQRNDAGQAMTVPLSTAGAFWGYRSDLSDGFDTIEDLLRPEFRRQLVVPYPIGLTGLFIVTCAIQRGGNEFDIEPGWEMVKELASAGTIGQVVTNNSEYINAMASGEHSVGFWNNGGWFATSQNFPVVIKNRMDDNKGFLYNEGYCVLKGSPLQTAFEFVNFFADPAMNELYNMNLGSGPTHPDAATNPKLADWYYQPEELERYAYFADFAHLGTVLNEWNVRWEREVVPLLR